MRVPLPGPLARLLIPAFARFFNILIEEAEHPPSAYCSFDDFFTRKLKAGIRPVEGSRVHPVDGMLTEQGEIVNGKLIQAKGWDYSLDEFLGDAELAKVYEEGCYYTYYLCPADYHRVHAPDSGKLVSARHIPGMLWPVNEWSVHNVERLFNLNERVVMNFVSDLGRWSLVMVGATNVGHMTMTFDPTICTKKWRWHQPVVREYSPPLDIKVGDDLGSFHLGSTVICVFEKCFPKTFARGPHAVKFGQAR
jgi:phosphatidylserine decarboxylase